MKQHIIDILKHNLGILVIGIVFLIFWFGGCHPQPNQPVSTHDTITNTTQQLQPIIINPAYTPQQAGQTILPINIPAQYNASQDIAKLTQQYNDLVIQLLSIKNYKDSITLRDTSGLRVGVVNLDQTVSNNTLKETKSSYQLYFPHTIQTITNTIYPSPKNQWFIGGTANSTLNIPKVGYDVDLLLKNKRDNVLLIGAGYTANQPLIKIGYFQKISFHK